MEDESQITVDNQLFFGRTEEQKQFRAALLDVLDQSASEKLPYIFLLYGIGGMGKTTLAKRFRDIALTEPPFEGDFQVMWIDWEEEARRTAALQVGREHVSAETVFQVIHAVAVRAGWGHFFQAYQRAIKDRERVQQEAAKALVAIDERDELAPIRAAGATVVSKLLRTALPAIGDPGEKLAQELLSLGIKLGADQAVRLRVLAETRLRARLDAKQYQLFLEPHEQLARALAEGLEQLARSRRLLLVLDTYEIADRADAWMRIVMRAAGPRIVWIVSGRSNLRDSRQFGNEPYFRGYAEDFPRRLLTYNMIQLAAEYVRAYFAAYAAERPLSDGALAALGRATRGIPLAVRLAADLWCAGLSVEDIVGDIDDVTPHREIVARVTERYLMHAVSPADRLALFALALAGGDVDQLRAMLCPENNRAFDLNAEVRRLERDYSSVHAETARLHDEASYFFLEHLRPETLRTADEIRHINQQGADALRSRLARLEGELPSIKDRCNDDDWVRAALGLADRLFWINETQAWRWLVPCFIDAVALSDHLRRGLCSVARTWHKQLSARGRRRLRALEHLTIEMTDEESADGLDELERLADQGWLAGEGEIRRRNILRAMKGNRLLEKGQYNAALKILVNILEAIEESRETLEEPYAEKVCEFARTLMEFGQHSGYSISSQPSGLFYFPEIETVLRKVVAWLPQKADAWHLLGVTLCLGDKPSEAVAALQHAIDLEPKEASHHHSIGNAYLAMGDYGAAVKAYRRATEVQPRFAIAYVGLGSAYAIMNLYEEAIASCKQATEMVPRDATPHVVLGSVYREQGRTAEALTEFGTAIRLDPKNPAAYVGVYQTQVLLGDRDQAEILLESAEKAHLEPPSELSGPFTEYQSILDRLGSIAQRMRSPDAHLWVSTIRLSFGDARGARASFRQVLQIEPQFFENLDASLNFNQTEEHEFADTATSLMRLAPSFRIAVGGQLAGIYVATAVSDMAHDRYTEALESLLHVIEINPADALAHDCLGQAYLGLARYPDAVKAGQRAVELDPVNPGAHFNLASAYIALGQLDEAETELDARIRLLPDNVFSPEVTLGIIARHNGEIESEEHFRRGLSAWDMACRQPRQNVASLLEMKAIALLCLAQKGDALRTLADAIAAMKPGEKSDLMLYNLLQRAPQPPDGIEEMIAMLKEADAKRKPPQSGAAP